MQIIKSHDYYQALLRDIPKSRRRIVITAMTVAYDGKTEPIFQMLEQALQRGVAVTLVFDVFTKSPFASGLATYLSTDRDAIKRLLEVCEHLKSQGATVHVLGTLGINPFAGRYHCKATVIDNAWYSFGGINFCAEGFVHTDYMLWGQSKHTADLL